MTIPNIKTIEIEKIDTRNMTREEYTALSLGDIFNVVYDLIQRINNLEKRIAQIEVFHTHSI